MACVHARQTSLHIGWLEVDRSAQGRPGSHRTAASLYRGLIRHPSGPQVDKRVHEAQVGALASAPLAPEQPGHRPLVRCSPPRGRSRAPPPLYRGRESISRAPDATATHASWPMPHPLVLVPPSSSREPMPHVLDPALHSVARTDPNSGCREPPQPVRARPGPTFRLPRATPAPAHATRAHVPAHASHSSFRALNPSRRSGSLKPRQLSRTQPTPTLRLPRATPTPAHSPRAHAQSHASPSPPLRNPPPHRRARDPLHPAPARASRGHGPTFHGPANPRHDRAKRAGKRGSPTI